MTPTVIEKLHSHFTGLENVSKQEIYFQKQAFFMNFLQRKKITDLEIICFYQICCMIKGLLLPSNLN